MEPKSLFRVLALALAVAAGLGAAPAKAASVEKTMALEFDKWIDLNLADGPVTVHRMRLERKTGDSMKGKLMRPGSADYFQDIQVQLEYDNKDKSDWKALVRFSLLDGEGTTIDGYSGDENLDDGKTNARDTITLPSLKYGLDHAKTLKFEISIGK